MNINADNLHFKELNDRIRHSGTDVVIENCIGQRFIGSGQSDKNITINGTPGNALGAYLNGATINVAGNAQDAVGDTMNDGLIVIHGNAGDALGYAMRGGKIFVKGNSGYRTGIHMKQYEDKKPVIVVGGSAGSFLGEYLAGGIIIILGLTENDLQIDYFTGAGMHGGKIFARCKDAPKGLPQQVAAAAATEDDLSEITEYLELYTSVFSLDFDDIINSSFYVLKPNAKNPYKRLYVSN